MVALDTCSLIWWTLAPEHLSATAAVACNAIKDTGAIVSSISIWEVGLAVKKGRLVLGLSIEDYLARLQRFHPVRIVPVDERIWLANLRLEWDHNDPADRTIVATAAMMDLPLITSDRVIGAYYAKTVW